MYAPIGYPVAQEFVLRSPDKPTSIIYEDISTCFEQLVNGTIAAVLSDAPVLNWVRFDSVCTHARFIERSTDCLRK